MVKKYKDIAEFYQEDPRRRNSPESDFGVWWRSECLSPGHDRGRTYRITWVHNTGEFYVWCSQTEEVYLMDRRASQSLGAEVAMDKWADNCGKINIEKYFPEIYEYVKAKAKI